tara:strand:+ start:388 stop:633 length:246 start_codon:yes stop_codon:yes gene_type:complete
MNTKIHNLIIAILLIIIATMTWKIYELKKLSKELEQFSIKNGVNCIENAKTMTQEEIEYCMPVMELLGFKYNPKTEETADE